MYFDEVNAIHRFRSYIYKIVYLYILHLPTCKLACISQMIIRSLNKNINYNLI